MAEPLTEAAKLRIEVEGFKARVENLTAKRDYLYRTFYALATDDRAWLATADEMIQGAVDIVVAERIELKRRLREAEHEMAQGTGAFEAVVRERDKLIITNAEQATAIRSLRVRLSNAERKTVPVES